MVNITQITEISSLSDVFTTANTLSGDLFTGVMFIILILILYYNLQSRTETAQALTGTFFIGFIFSIFLRIIGLLNITFVFLFAFLTAGGIWYLYSSSD